PRDPSAEAGADGHCILEPELRGQIEIEIGEIIDRTRGVNQWRVAVAGMPRRDDQIIPRQELEPWSLGCQPSPACRNRSGRPSPHSTTSKFVPAIDIVLASVCRGAVR